MQVSRRVLWRGEEYRVAKTVLIVDDDPSVIDLLVSIMTMLGVDTRIAHNGREALAAIQTTPPDAVILDLMMPVMDGFTMLSQLRKEENGQKLPVIILSALADQKGAVERLPGIVGSITKGRFSLMELREMLNKAGVLIDPDNLVGKPASPPAPSQSAPSSATASTPAAPTTAASDAKPDTPPISSTTIPLHEDTLPTPPLGVPRTNGRDSSADGDRSASTPTKK